MGNFLLHGDYSSGPDDLMGMALGMMLAFLGGHVVAWVYMACHSGLSYSRSFVNALVVLCLIVSVVMMVMANNLLIAFGLMAVFAIVRFRNILRDTLDTTYILASITIGMACGTRKFTTAIVGTLVFAILMLYLHWTQFGVRHRYDLILNLHWGRPQGPGRVVGTARPARAADHDCQSAVQCRLRGHGSKLPAAAAGPLPARGTARRASGPSRGVPCDQSAGGG